MPDTVETRLLNAIIDACVLLDRRWPSRLIDRIFLWAWMRQQSTLPREDAGVMLYDAATRRWYHLYE